MDLLILKYFYSFFGLKNTSIFSEMDKICGKEKFGEIMKCFTS